MTELRTPSPGRLGPRPGDRRRPHAAARSRIVSAGIAGTAAFGMVAAMALPSGAPTAGPSTASPFGVTADGHAVATDPGRSLVVPVPAPSVRPAPATSSGGS